MSIGSFISSVAKPFEKIGSAIVKGVEAVGSFAMQTLTFATSLLTSRMFAPQTPGYDASGSTGGVTGNARVQVQPNTTTPIPMVYGTAFLGGKFVDAALTTDGQVMYYVFAITAISDNGTIVFNKNSMYYGDRKITFDALPGNPARVMSLTDNAGNVDTKIQNKLNITLFTSDKDGNITNYMYPGQMPWGSGTGVMGPDSGLPTALQWSATNRKMYGTAFAIVRLQYSSEAGTTQMSPLTFSVSQFMNGPYVAKPGHVWYDYMTNKIYGAAVDPAYIDLASADALNDYSDELITFSNYSGGSATQARYRINGVLNTGINVLQNVDQILTACDSWMQYNAVSGKWAIVINKADAPSMAFDDDNIIGDIALGSVDINQAPNQIEAKFPDATNRDQYNYVNISVPTGLLYPNEPINKTSVTYELVNDSVQALYLANRFLEQNREDLLVTIQTNYQGIQTNAGDVVTVTNAAYGWDAKKFRAISVSESVNEDKTLSASIQLIEYNAQVYDNADITQYVPADNSDNPSSGYFSDLSPPAVVDSFPYAASPTFDINVAIPLKGRVTSIILYYTTSATPIATDWQVLDTQALSDSTIYVAGSTITFTDFNLAPASYYFAFKVGNDVAQSVLSPASTLFNWAPDSANSSSFVSTLSPVTLQVPYNGTTPTLTGINFRLYGSNGLGPVPYVEANTDSDPAFVPGSWRIGYNDYSGYATDIIQTGITFPLPPTDLGSYAQFATATAMTASPATVQIPVRYKDLAGAVHLIPTSTIQAVYSVQGTPAYQRNTAYLYQWSTTTPANPSGTSVFTWSTGLSSSYTGGGGWDTAIPANPNVPLIKLWRAAIGVSDVASATTTIVSWTSGYAVADITQNGANGVQNAQPTVYQWAVTIPSAPTGTSTYTWSTATFTPIPAGWSATAGTPVAGNTLWGATVVLTEGAGTVSSTINWTTASISARGYSGEAGASARICYTKTTLTALASTPATITTAGSSSYPPNNSWGTGTVWQATPQTIIEGESVYQSDGIYSPTTGNTVWNVPYLSNLKVGNLQAISANMGSLTSGTITGALIRTAASGQRVEMDYASNYLSSYNNSGTLTTQIGGFYGGLFINATLPVNPGAQIQHTSTSVPALNAINTGAGIQGNSTAGFGIIAFASNTGGNNHALGGKNTAFNGGAGGGTATSGLIGVANGYDFYADGAGLNYGPFTGAHDVLVPNGTTINVGYICVDVECIIKKNISNTVFEVAESTTANEVPIGVIVINNGSLANFAPAVFIEKYDYIEVNGIQTEIPVYYPEYDLVKNDYQYCGINAVGEGQVYVCGEAGNIAAGDLIVTSSTAGVGMKQSDNIVRNITVAKAREAVTFTDTTTPILVACIYLCG